MLIFLLFISLLHIRVGNEKISFQEFPQMFLFPRKSHFTFFAGLLNRFFEINPRQRLIYSSLPIC